MTLTIKLDGNWSSFQLANNTPPLSVTGSVIAPSARMSCSRGLDLAAHNPAFATLLNWKWFNPTSSRPPSLPCYPEGCAAPGNVQGQCNTLGPLSKLKRAPTQGKIFVTSKSPVGDISVVTLIRTDTTLDHSQKAEKV